MDITFTANRHGEPRDFLGSRNDGCYDGYITIDETDGVKIDLCDCGRMHVSVFTHNENLSGMFESTYTFPVFKLIYSPDFS